MNFSILSSIGDGSTSTIVVANALFQALTDPKTKSYLKESHLKDIVDMLNDISEFIEKELKASAKPLSKNMSELDIIAAVANNDTEVGKLIGQIYRKKLVNMVSSMDVLDKKDKDYMKSNLVSGKRYIDSLQEDKDEKNHISTPNYFKNSTYI